MSTSERTKILIEKIEADLISEGYLRGNRLWQHLDTGPCSYDCFFDYLVDLRLGGQEFPSTEKLWEDTKRQYNYLISNLAKASEDYTKLANKEKHLRKDLYEITKENWELLDKIKELEGK